MTNNEAIGWMITVAQFLDKILIAALGVALGWNWHKVRSKGKA